MDAFGTPQVDRSECSERIRNTGNVETCSEGVSHHVFCGLTPWIPHYVQNALLTGTTMIIASLRSFDRLLARLSERSSPFSFSHLSIPMVSNLQSKGDVHGCMSSYFISRTGHRRYVSRRGRHSSSRLGPCRLTNPHNHRTTKTPHTDQAKRMVSNWRCLHTFR